MKLLGIPQALFPISWCYHFFGGVEGRENRPCEAEETILQAAPAYLVRCSTFFSTIEGHYPKHLTQFEITSKWFGTMNNEASTTLAGWLGATYWQG